MSREAAHAPLRVLFLSTYFPKPANPTIGPWALLQAQGLQRAGVEITVVSFTSWVPKVLARSPRARAWAECPREHVWGGVRALYPRWPLYQVNPFKKWAFRNPERQLRLAWWVAGPKLTKLVKALKPDVVFAHHTGVNGYLAERLHRKFGLPYVVTDHDFEEITECARLPGRRRLFARVIGSAFANVCVARRMEKDMKEVFPSARARTVHNGIDLPPAEVCERPRPAELAGKKVIVSAGVMYERKGFPLLVEAFARVAGKHPDALLRIVGDGVKRPAAEEMARRLGVEKQVQFLGFLSRERALQEIAWGDFFALVGWDEPFATVFIEAMGCGKPIITASDGGINDVVEDGVHGLSVAPRDAGAAAAAMDRLLSDPAEVARMGKNARALVESRLTWSANARIMLELFGAAAGRG